jgi:hypothetical protein
MVTGWYRRTFQTAPTVTDLLVDAIVGLGQTRNRLEISFDKRREPDAREQRPLAMSSLLTCCRFNLLARDMSNT